MRGLWKALTKQKAPKINGNLSFSQCGEDVVVDFLFKLLNIGPVSYLDLGANDPIKFNNTYKFYLDGSKGVLVEPDRHLVERIFLTRPRDLCLAKAVSVTVDHEVDFYKMSADTLSTTMKNTAERYQEETEHHLTSRIKVPAVHINSILAEFDSEFSFNFVSLDVEGLDLDILRAWDFTRWRPAVFCIETLTYTQAGKAAKVTEIFKRMEEVGYHVYADSYINSIFVAGERFVPAQRQV